MADDLVKVKKTTEEYELKKSDLVPETGDDAPTITNKIAGLLDKFRVISFDVLRLTAPYFLSVFFFILRNFILEVFE